jgi:hypothetical protein
MESDERLEPPPGTRPPTGENPGRIELALIRWMLSRTLDESLRFLEQTVRTVLRIRENNVRESG